MRHPLLDQLPDDVRHTLMPYIQRFDFARGATVFRQGEHARGLYFIDAGLVQFGIDTASGESTFIGIAKPGFYLGDCEILAKKPHFAMAGAFTPCSISLLPRANVEQAMRSFPDFSIAVAQRLARSLHLVQMVQMARHQLSIEQNLVGIISYLAQHFGTLLDSGHYRVDIELSQDQLADMAGVTRQSLHKPLQAWKAAGMIDYHYGNLDILDMPALLKLLASPRV